MGYSDEQLQQVTQWMIDRIPLKQIGKAEDVGKLVSYFSSDAANFIIGADLIMDGGMSLKY